MTRSLLALFGIGLCSAATLAIGCGHSDSSAAETGAAGAAGSEDVETCPADAGVETFTPNMVASGTNAQIKVTLMTITPAPADKGDNDWVVKITDENDQPLDGLTVTPKPYMPLHHHGASIVPTVMPMGGGVYDLQSLVLFMPGVWQVTIAVSAPNIVDSAVFTFCVTGLGHTVHNVGRESSPKLSFAPQTSHVSSVSRSAEVSEVPPFATDGIRHDAI
jgi:hypothetical protein